MPIPIDIGGGPAQMTWYIGQDHCLYIHELQTDCLFKIYEDIKGIEEGGPAGPPGPPGPPGPSGPIGAPGDPGLIEEAPVDGQTYARENSGWSVIPQIPTAALVITTIQPSSAAENESVPLTVTGTGFTPTSVVNWGGYPIGTTFIDNTTLTAVLTLGPGSSGIYTVVVTDGPALSNSVAFTVNPAGKTFTATGISCALDINPDGDLIATQAAGPNAGKSVNLTYGKWA